MRPPLLLCSLWDLYRSNTPREDEDTKDVDGFESKEMVAAECRVTSQEQIRLDL